MNIYRHSSFIALVFLGGAVLGFKIYRAINFFNLLKGDSYSDHTIFLNTFYELLLGIPIGGLLGVGLAFFFLNKNVKTLNLAIGLSLGILFTSVLNEALDRQLRPPLVRAAQHNHLARIQRAIQKGNDLNVKDFNGKTALIEASWRKSFPLAKALIQAGADVNAVDNFGYTALTYAAIYGDYNIDIVKALIEAGADVNTATTEGDTVLILTLLTSNTNTETVKVLVQAGADVNVVNERGYTALELAKDKNLTDVIRILREAGAQQ